MSRWLSRRRTTSLLVAALTAASTSVAYGQVSDDELQLVSTSSLGVKGLGDSTEPAITPDGRWVAFASNAPNLDPADHDHIPDIFVKNLITGELILVSTSSTGFKGNRSSSAPSISDDGLLVAFGSFADNLHPHDKDDVMDVFVKNLSTGELALVSERADGTKADDFSGYPAISGDGHAIAFTSWAKLDPRDVDVRSDVYVKRLDDHSLTLASTRTDGIKGNNDSSSGSINSDGRIVVFVSRAWNLHPLDTDVEPDVFAKDLATGVLDIVTRTKEQGSPTFEVRSPSVSSNGRLVSFSSRHPYGGIEDDDLHVWVRNMRSGSFTLASSRADGTPANGGAYRATLTRNGKALCFVTSARNLSKLDDNKYPDAYYKNVRTGAIRLASVADGKVGNKPTESCAISNKRLVTFSTKARNLLPEDRDKLFDVYVRHV